ncbi:endonuclease/exonuclease/phosphatase family protein [Bordetella sp. FB-8]|uniref:endonuclease/exonuclease/phosphatase family protein n=1 Tax=Bordetella sp. FB-8 TaxID=1159870 RepID=UPI0003668C71|nr:endonuclease/exonuclease/phosphatase family protein [Bordetella sp. FB-8]
MARLRVVTYNIHKGRSPLGLRESLNGLRPALHGLRPDLVFLQEVQGRNESVIQLDAQHESLATALDLNMVYGRNAVRQRTDHGNAFLSRHAIVRHENQDISDHRLEQRGLLHVLIDLEGIPVHCFVVHLGLFAGGRQRQAQALAERLRAHVPDDAPVLVAGDFNDWGNKLASFFTQGLGLTDVFGQTPRTFPSLFPWFRLDRIYQRGFDVHEARVLRGPQWARLSDHAPLLAELELRLS